MRRLRPNQEKVRSTSQRRGRLQEPGFGPALKADQLCKQSLVIKQIDTSRIQ
jgi:hypothetical protein